ncbi:MAG: dipeptidase [Planctomycetaceae bacterium]
MLILDAHLDLSMNAQEWNRDLTRSLAEVRRRELGKTDKVDRAIGVITLPEMRAGKIGVCIATQIGRVVGEGSKIEGWNSPEQAWAHTQGQLAWYRAMEDSGQMYHITKKKELAHFVDLWQSNPPDDAPIGYVLSLEGADSIVNLKYLEKAYAYGLRAIGPAHYGPGRYSPGTNAFGGLTSIGRDLVKEMDRLGIVLDCTHLTDEAFFEALEIYQGPVWASHNNCRALVPHQRQFSDDQLKELIRRDAVIGGAFDAWMMHPYWVRGTSTPQGTGVDIERIVEHFDHICQLAGTARHCGIGSDLDGGYGKEQCPHDLETIADLQKLTSILARRGYSQADIEGIMYGNWVRKLGEVLDD